MWLLACFLLQHPASLYQQGVAALERGDMPAAATALQEAARLSPKNAQYWKALGVAHAAQHSYRPAQDAFREACTLAPTLADACYYYARALYATDQYAESLAVMKKALPREQRKGRAECSIAQAQEALGDNPASESSYRAALTRSDHLSESRLAYARFLIRQGRAAEALPPLAAIAEENPDSLFEQGRANWDMGKLAASRAALDRALALDQRHLPTRVLLGKVCRRLGFNDEAAKHEAIAKELQGSTTSR